MKRKVAFLNNLQISLNHENQRQWDDDSNNPWKMCKTGSSTSNSNTHVWDFLKIVFRGSISFKWISFLAIQHDILYPLWETLPEHYTRVYETQVEVLFFIQIFFYSYLYCYLGTMDRHIGVVTWVRFLHCITFDWPRIKDIVYWFPKASEDAPTF